MLWGSFSQDIRDSERGPRVCLNFQGSDKAPRGQRAAPGPFVSSHSILQVKQSPAEVVEASAELWGL